MIRPRVWAPRAVLAAALTVGVALAIAACDDSDDGRDGAMRGKPISLVIGNSIPLSGDLKDLGPAARKAANLALEQIEDAIEADERRDSIELTTADSGTDPATALATIEEMVDVEGASCVVGPWSPTETVTVARDLAIPRGVVLISPAATLDELSTLEDDDLVNRTVPPDSYQGIALADAIADDLDGAEGHTVSIAARDDAYGEPIAAAFERAWTDDGGEIGERVVYRSGADPGAVAERVAESDADALVLIDFASEFERLAPELERVGAYDPETTWGVDFLASTNLPDRLDDDGLLDGLRGTTPGLPDNHAPTSAFTELFDGADPGEVKRASFDAQAFDGVILCYLAALAAGASDGELIAEQLGVVSAPPGKAYSWEQLPNAVEAIADGEEIDYEGASGPLDLSPSGDPATGVYDLYEYVGSELHIIGEAPFDATADN